MSRRRLHPVVVAASLLAIASVARAERVPRVGVVVSLAINVDDAQATAVSQEIGDALREKLMVDVIAGDAAKARLPETGIPETCLTDAKCIQDIGSRLDAEEVLFLVIVSVGEGLNIEPTWAEVASGRAVTRNPIQVEGAGEARVEAFRAAATALLPDAKVRAANVVIGPGTGDPVLPPPTTRRGRHFTTGVWIAGGVAVAALGAGVVFGLSATSKEDDLRSDGCDEKDCGPGTEDRINDMETSALLADISFGVAAASAIVSVILYLRSGGSEEAAAPAPDTTTNVRLVPGGALLGFHRKW